MSSEKSAETTSIIPMSFNFKDKPVSVIKINDVPWFYAKEICTILELKNVGSSLSKLDADEKSDTRFSNIPNGDVYDLLKPLDVNGALGHIFKGKKTSGRPLAIINESGLYSLILRSRTPKAKDFKRWITRDVIPALFRTGTYTTPWASERTQTTEADLRYTLELQRKLIEMHEKFAAAKKPKVDYNDPNHPPALRETVLIRNTWGVQTSEKIAAGCGKTRTARWVDEQAIAMGLKGPALRVVPVEQLDLFNSQQPVVKGK